MDFCFTKQYGKRLEPHDSLTTAGWYKVAEKNVNTKDIAHHSVPEVFNICLGSMYAYSDNRGTSFINVVCSYNLASAKTINISGQTITLTKVREVYYETEKKSYLEIYYAGNNSNPVYCVIETMTSLYKKIDFILDTGTPTFIIFEHTI